MNRIRAVVLTLACVGVFCVFTDAAAESTLEVWTGASDLEDALGFLGENVPISGKSGCVAHVKAGKNHLSASLRKKDKAYKAAYKKLKATDKASRAQYALTKQALNHKVANAASGCKHKLAAKLSAKDAKYTAAYAKLMKQKKSIAAKAKLTKDMAALKKLYHKAIKGKKSGAVKSIRAHFSRKFKALKHASAYYRAAQKLRHASAWYSKYSKQKKAYVHKCRKSVRTDVVTAMRLLKGQSKWYKDYENLIAHSAWYKQYKASIAKALAVCAKTGNHHAAKKAMHAGLKKMKAKKAKKKAAAKKKKKLSKEGKAKAKAKRHAKRVARRAKRHAKLKKAIKQIPANVKGKISDAIARARAALSKAKTPAEKAAAKAAVKKALADAGVVDADNAGTIAWAKHSLDMASKWADSVNAREARSLSKVTAWKPGQRKTGIKMRRSCERVVQAMVAVAHSTRNAAMVSREAKRRHLGKLKSFNAPIKAARRSSHDAEKAVQNARAAMAATLGTKSRIAAHHALARAEDAVHDANSILKMEVKKRDDIETNRLRSDGAKLVGENELHYEARKTFHRANRVLAKVSKALAHARKNHYAHKEALMKKKQKAAVARRAAVKAAKAGKVAAMKAMESAEVKAELYSEAHGGKKTPAEVALAVQNEAHTAYLAARAVQMMHSVVTGGGVPKAVQVLVETHKPGAHVPSPEELTAGTHAEKVAQSLAEPMLPSNRMVSHWLSERNHWKNHYKNYYAMKLERAKKHKGMWDHHSQQHHHKSLAQKYLEEAEKNAARKAGNSGKNAAKEKAAAAKKAAAKMAQKVKDAAEKKIEAIKAAAESKAEKIQKEGAEAAEKLGDDEVEELFQENVMPLV